MSPQFDLSVVADRVAGHLAEIGPTVPVEERVVRGLVFGAAVIVEQVLLVGPSVPSLVRGEVATPESQRWADRTAELAGQLGLASATVRRVFPLEGPHDFRHGEQRWLINVGAAKHQRQIVTLLLLLQERIYGASSLPPSLLIDPLRVLFADLGLDDGRRVRGDLRAAGGGLRVAGERRGARVMLDEGAVSAWGAALREVDNWMRETGARPHPAR